ncbi:MAG: hypothetical protein ACREL5_14895, partial [Gemmatimonadales bacterium]
MHRSFLLVVTTLAIAACAHPAVSSAPSPESSRRAATPAASGPEIAPLSAAMSARVQHLLDSLPLRDRIAQLIMPWITGTYQPLDAPAMRQALAWV